MANSSPPRRITATSLDSLKVFFMQAYKCRAVLPENHRLVLDLPRDIPTGAVEIIVLSSPGETAGAFDALPEDWQPCRVRYAYLNRRLMVRTAYPTGLHFRDGVFRFRKKSDRYTP